MLNEFLSETLDHATSEQDGKNENKKNAQPTFQIHHQQLQRYGGQAGLRETRSNSAKPVLALAFSEFAFDGISFTGIPFDLILLFTSRTVLRWSSQSRAAEPDAMLLAKVPVLAGAIDLIRLYDSWKIAEATTVVLDRLDELYTLVEVIPGRMIQESVTFRHADSELCAELHSRLRFPAHDRPYMRLMDAHDAVFDLVRSRPIHVELLAVQFMNHQQITIGFATQQRKRLCLCLFGNDGQISSDVSKLPSDRFANDFRSRPALFGHRQKLLARLFLVGARFCLLPMTGSCSVSMIASSFSRASFSRFRSVRYAIRRGAGGVHQQCPLIRLFRRRGGIDGLIGLKFGRFR